MTNRFLVSVAALTLIAGTVNEEMSAIRKSAHGFSEQITLERKDRTTLKY